jgi:hypothetical protein
MQRSTLVVLLFTAKEIMHDTNKQIHSNKFAPIQNKSGKRL